MYTEEEVLPDLCVEMWELPLGVCSVNSFPLLSAYSSYIYLQCATQEHVPAEALTDTQHLPQIHGWLPGGRWNLTLSATPCVRTQTDLMSDFFIYMCILFGVKPLSAEIDVCLLILLVTVFDIQNFFYKFKCMWNQLSFSFLYYSLHSVYL